MKWGLADLSVTELVGTTAVVLSLIFVGVGIRDSNREARAATIQASLNTEMYLHEMIALYASVWDKVVNEEPLETAEERRRGTVLFNMVITESENRFLQTQSGFLDDQALDGRVNSLVPLLRLPIYEEWIKTAAAMNHSADFLEFLEDLKEAGNE